MSLFQSPFEEFTGPQRHHGAGPKPETLRTQMIDFDEIDGLFISRSTVEVGAKVTGKGLQFIETVLLLEDFGIERNCRVRAVATGTSARRFLCFDSVWC